jgi:hypothetical protein
LQRKFIGARAPKLLLFTDMWASALLIFTALNASAARKEQPYQPPIVHTRCTALLYESGNRATKTLEMLIETLRHSDLDYAQTTQLRTVDAEIVMMLADVLGLEGEDIRAEYTTSLEMLSMKYETVGVVTNKIRRQAALEFMRANRPSASEQETIEAELKKILGD